MIDLTSVRFPVTIDGADHDLDVDELYDAHELRPGSPEALAFAEWCARECSGDELTIARVALAQAYAAPDGGLALAAESTDDLSFVKVSTFDAIRAGDGAAIRTTLGAILVCYGDRRPVVRARLYAACCANGIPTNGAEKGPIR